MMTVASKTVVAAWAALRLVTWGAGLVLGLVTMTAWAQVPLLQVGAGAVTLKPRGSDAAVPAAPHRGEAQRKLAVPTNQ